MLGKGNKERLVPLNGAAKRAMAAYLSLAERAGAEDSSGATDGSAEAASSGRPAQKAVSQARSRHATSSPPTASWAICRARFLHAS